MTYPFFFVLLILADIDAKGVLEGVKSLSSSSAAAVNSVGTGGITMSGSSSSSAAYLSPPTISGSVYHFLGMEPVHQQKIDFDQDRQCLMWTIRSSHLKPYLLVWDLTFSGIARVGRSQRTP